MLTTKTADIISRIKISELRDNTVDIAKKLILDYIGVSLAGAHEKASCIVADYAKNLKCKPESGVIGHAFKSSPCFSALVNGTTAHALDYDDYSMAMMGHPTAPILSAILPLSEQIGASGSQIIEAYVAGIETASLLPKAASQHYEKGWHCTGTLGSLAAAAASSKLLGLSPPKIETALAIGASLAGGLRHNFGTMTKPLHAGRAALNGVQAAILAKNDFSAAPSVLETTTGFLAVFGATGFQKHKICSPRDFYAIENPGIALKAYPSCAATHCGIDATLFLCNEYAISHEDIVTVELNTHSMLPLVLPYHRPKTATEARFSLEYCISRALISREVLLRHFTDAAVLAPDIQHLISKVKYLHNAGREESYNFRTEVTVKLRNGKVFTYEVKIPKGDPTAPMSWSEVLEKYHDCASNTLPAKAVDNTINLILEFESLSDVAKLMDILTYIEPKGKGAIK